MAFVVKGHKREAHVINREFIREEKDFPSVQCFAHALDFLDSTFLELFGVEAPAECQGTSHLRDHEREAVIFGYFGGAVNVTDGR